MLNTIDRIDFIFLIYLAHKMATNACKHYPYEEITALNPSAKYGLVKVKGVSFLINLDGKLSVADYSYENYNKTKDCHICANCGNEQILYYVNDREKKHYIIRDDLAIIPVKQYEIEVKEFVPFAVYDDPRFGAFICHVKSRKHFIVYFLTCKISLPVRYNGSFIIDDKEVVGVMAKISDKCQSAADYSLLFVNSEGECITDGVIVYAESDNSYMFNLECGQLSGEYTHLGVNWTYTSAAALKTKPALAAAACDLPGHVKTRCKTLCPFPIEHNLPKKYYIVMCGDNIIIKSYSDSGKFTKAAIRECADS